ncbi:uncharacterized protein LOC134189156 [Corticium candelabrum]|uniref:uncharacterized protein LOC134189156 n=1 Tax=Corticium candelabrum TaxID=121492 RepID=UPI002E2628BF|nr:uncharacterized protein LOC134189156 [Corticium candelabrum]
MTVSVANPRQDSRGKWLCGIIIQLLGPATYLVSVEGGTRYIHIDQLRQHDGRSFPEYTWESTGDISVPTMNQDNGNRKRKGQDQRSATSTSTSTSSGSSQDNNSAQENITETTPMSQQSHQVPSPTAVAEERRCPLRENRKLPAGYRQS